MSCAAELKRPRSLIRNSETLARELLQDRGHIDVFASADAEVNDRMLKPAGLATWTIRFAEGSMVLAYTTASKNAATLAAAGTQGAVPHAAADWTAQLAAPGVAIGGSHPFLGPAAHPGHARLVGLSIVADAPHRQRAEQFMALFLSPEGVALRGAGPTTIAPAQVNQADLAQLPAPLRTLVRAVTQ